MKKTRRLALHWQILIGMFVGAAIGLSLNFACSTTERTLDSGLPEGITRAVLRDSANRVEITLVGESATRTLLVDALGEPAASAGGEHFKSLDELKAAEPAAHALFMAHGQSPARRWGALAQRLGGLFLRLLRMVAVPLVATSLITGVMGLGGAQQLGRLFTRTFAYYMLTSMLAILTGLLLVNVIRPGLRGNMRLTGDVDIVVGESHLGEILLQQVEGMIPLNPIAALAQNEFLAIIVFSIAFGVFALRIGGRTQERLRDFFSDGFDVIMAMTSAIIRLAPLGVLLLMIFVTATQGWEVFKSLFWYMLTVVVGLAIHSLISLPLIAFLAARRKPHVFAQQMAPALLTAFSSASSNAALPVSMSCAENRAGIPNRICSFVLPLGATVNMDGTALYEVVAVQFIAQLYLGHSLSLSQQLIVAVTALLVSVGAAGIPHAGLVMMVVIMQAVGLPLEAQGIILAVDRVLDMCRTAVNVWSDAVGAAVMHKFEPAEG